MLKKIIEEALKKFKKEFDDTEFGELTVVNIAEVKDFIEDEIKQAYKAGKEDALKKYLPDEKESTGEMKAYAGRNGQILSNTIPENVGFNDCRQQIIDRAKKDGTNNLTN